MTAMQHLLNAAQNLNTMQCEGVTAARRMTALAQIEHARRAILDMQTRDAAANDPVPVYTPTLQELVEEGCIPMDVPNDYLTEM